MRILIADDDAVCRWLLRTALAKLGHETIEAADGVSAWAALDDVTPPDLAVLDWMMPGGDGPELCKRVRADPRLRGIYLVILTVKSGAENADLAVGAGADDFIAKPFQPSELRARLELGLRIADLQRRLGDAPAAAATAAGAAVTAVATAAPLQVA